MQYRSIFKALGLVNMILGLCLLVPTIYAIIAGTSDLVAFVYSTMIAIFLGMALAFIPRSKDDLRAKDGFALVAFGWLTAGLFGCFPFFLSGAIPSFTDAFFESISGFTTTGASIMTDIEAMPPAILLWRSMTQWLGGMGIIVLSLAIIPYLEIGGMSIFQAEVPGPTAEKLTPRIQDTAKVLWMIYLIFTIALTLLLWAAGMSGFDAINHALTTLSTGGFSTNNASVAGFNSPLIEWILVIFMGIAGVNFALHYRFMFRGLNYKTYSEDSEIGFYLLSIVVAVTLITVAILTLVTDAGGFEKALRDTSFTVVSILTTTGFGGADYELWPLFGQFILLFLMIMGGCAGSTSGGIKAVRVMLVLKYMYVEMLKMIHPTLIRTVKLRNSVVERNVLGSILGFIFIYTSTMIVSILLVSFDTGDMETAIGSVVASLSNIGPGFGTVGPTENYSHLGDFTKWVLSIDMVMGRLEILTILVLLMPQTWKK